MAEIRISVKPRHGARSRFGAELALANISVLDSDDPQLGRRVKNDLIVPVSGDADPALVDLAAGRYVISVAMPSGEQLVQQLDVIGDEPVNFVLGSPVSSDGSPSSKRTIARIQRAPGARRVDANDVVQRRVRTTDGAYISQEVLREDKLSTPVSLLSVARRTSVPQRATVRSPERAPVPNEVPSIVDLWGPDPGGRSPFLNGSGLVDTEDWLRWMAWKANQMPALGPADSERDVRRFELSPLSNPAMKPRFTADLWQSAPRRHTSQRYAVSLRPDGRVSSLAVVPWHWLAHEEQEAPCAINIYKEWDGSWADWSMRVGVQDGRMSSVLAYLTQGDLSSAQTLLKSSLRMLMAKVENPYAAAAGGYVLIYSKREDIDEPEWPSWIRNLATWFPSSPDAQILLATLCLQRRRLLNRVDLSLESDDRQRLRLARTLLERALRAGLPMYSLGMRLLVENLEILFDEESAMGLHDEVGDLRLSETLRHVRTVSSCMKTVQPMTVLHFSDLWRSLTPRPRTKA